MMNIYFRILLVIPFLTACASTIDRRVSLSDEFELQSEVYAIDSPTWMIPDSVYNKKIGSYSVIDADTSSRSSKDKLLSSNVKENLINFFVFGDKDLYNKVEKFEVVSTKNFSFIIKNDKADLSRSQCKITSISIDERKEALITARNENENEIPRFSSSDSVNNRAARTSTALSCEIKQGDEVYNLNLFSNKNRKTNVTLSSDIEEIIVEDIDLYIVLEINTDYNDENTDSDDLYYPRRYAINSGLGLYMNAEQVSALSFVGKPRIWLKDNLPEDKKQLFLSVAYSLLMFNWLDSAWR
jgi:hypothetical protein